MRWLWVFLALWPAACRVSRDPRVDAPEPQATQEVRRVWYPGREQLKKRYSVLLRPEGGVVKHGPESEWFEDGSVRAERSFRHGEPTGIWRTYHPGGAPESVVEIGDGATLLPMRWWYPDGQLRASGLGVGGVREGEWSYWHPGGQLAERGPFLHSLRHGPWVLYDADGVKRAEGRYDQGRRVGPWLLWDERGQLHEKQGDALPEGVGSGQP